jgi:hypothetical protein
MYVGAAVGDKGNPEYAGTAWNCVVRTMSIALLTEAVVNLLPEVAEGKSHLHNAEEAS